MIKSMGFDHVRLSVNPQPMMSRGHADEIPADYLSWLDTAVQMILKQGLAVVIDVHPESEFKTKLASEGEFTEQFTDYWRGRGRESAQLRTVPACFFDLRKTQHRDPLPYRGAGTRGCAGVHGRRTGARV